MLSEGKMFGRYKILSRLGSGGMGAVYKAQDTVKNILVAIKVIHPHIAEIKQFIGRFHQEAKLLEKLAHPKVVRIYDSGVIDGNHYIAMEFVVGKSLTSMMNERAESTEGGILRFTPFPEEGVMRVLEQMARVLQEAAELGVIHRDIKPDNIVVTDIEKWDIKLLDFGIAKDTAELHTMLSQTGQVMGTPAYMSPEQCEGRNLDIRSDLYSLGIMAYQCASGKLPFEGPTTMAYIKQHLFEQPQPLNKLNPDISAGLAGIIHKLLMKTPQERYQSPLDLLEDLNRVRRGEMPRFMCESATKPAPVTPAVATFGTLDTPTFRTETRAETLHTGPSKKNSLYIAVGVVVVLVVLGVVGWLFLGKKEPVSTPELPKKSGEVTDRESDEKMALRKSLEEALKTGDIDKALKALDSIDSLFSEDEMKDEMKKVFGAVRRIVDEAEKAEDEKGYEELQEINKLLNGMDQTDDVNRLVERVRKRMKYIELVTAADKALNGGDFDRADDAIREAKKLFDTKRVQELARISATRKASKQKAEEWKRLIEEGDDACKRGDWKAAESSYKAALAIREDEDVSRKYKQVKDELSYAEIVAKGERLLNEGKYDEAVMSFKDALTLFKRKEATDARDFAEIASSGVARFKAGDYQRAVTYLEGALQLREDGKLRQMLVQARARSGEWWRMLSEQGVSHSAHRGELNSMAIFGNLLFSVGDDGRISVFDNNIKRDVTETMVNDGKPLSLAVKNNIVVVGTTTGFVKICSWDGKTLTESKSIAAHKSWVRAVEISSDNSFVVSGGYDGVVCVIDTSSGVVRRRIETKSGWIYSLKMVSDKRVAVAAADKMITIWDIESGEKKTVLSGHNGVVWALDVSSDGKRILSTANDGSLCLWSVGSDGGDGKLLNKMQLKRNANAVFMDKYSDIALASTDTEVLVFDARNGSILKRFGIEKVKTLAVSDDYECIFGRKDGSIFILSINTQKR
jgi:serine/threonine-protein kinase